MGSAGTAVGLHIGMKLLDLKTKIVPVRVIEHEVTGEERIRSAFEDTISFLHHNDPSIPPLEFNKKEFQVRDDFLGPGYGQFTEEGNSSIKRLKETEDIQLDGTYTAKAMAALVDDAEKGMLRDKTVLFWNTLNAVDFDQRIRNLEYKCLPKKLHHFFETATQEEGK
jgi:D-cysteine desulfhydrase